MVKFKSRYLLIEVLYEDKMLQKHDASKFAKIIKNEVEKNFGEIIEKSFPKLTYYNIIFHP